MKKVLLISFSIILFACNSKENNIKNTISVEKESQLKYYKCNYSEAFDTLVMSGESNQNISEIWGVDKKDFKSLPKENLDQVNLNIIIDIAHKHLVKRFPNTILEFSSLTLEKIDEKDSKSLHNFFYNISFIYDKRGYYQCVPILLDKRIVLSNNE